MTATAEQQAIVAYPLQPLRVAAGAGTGKTTTMAWRLASLVADHGIAPEEALGVTFTNKAAQELGDHIRRELPDHAAAGRTVEVTTYHGFAYGILREWGALVGVERTSPLVTPGYTRQLLRDALAGGRGYQELDLTYSAGRVDELAPLAGQLGDHLLEPSRLTGAAATEAVERRRAELATVLVRYQHSKAAIGAVDYADLIRLCHDLLRDHPGVAALIRARYRVVLLDEYQDTNPAQRELLLRVFGEGFPVTAVGDTDQTIYEWRGASLENFQQFPEHFSTAPGEPAATLPLTVNWRSDEAILGLANRVRDRIGGPSPAGPLRPRSAADSGNVVYGWFSSAKDEARAIAEEVVRLHDQEGRAWRDMAILFRRNSHIGLVRDALELADVPVEVAALGGLLGVPEVNDVHAWMKLLGRPDDGAALVRVLVRGRFRLGLGDVAPLAAWLRDRRGSDDGDDDPAADRTLLDAVYAFGECGVRPEAAQRLAAFLDLYRELLRVAQGVSLVELARTILDRTGAWQDVEAMDDAARLSARLNLYRFLDLAEEWSPLEGRPSLDAFLDYLDLLQEDRANDELDTARLGGDDAVAMLTVHRAKGLEWPVVFLPALCHGVFPSAGRRYDDPDRHAMLLPYRNRLDAARLADLPGPGKEREAALAALHADQEWRTAYVAVTRAKHRLYGTGGFWYTEGKPRERSELLAEFAASPGVTVLADVSEPGEPPESLRLEMLTEGAPDPHFADGWQAALRAALADRSWPERHAAVRGAAAAYHARVEQLRLTLDGLPPPVAVPEEDTALRTSVTGLVTYATCPLRFRWTEVDRLPRRPSRAARRGVEVHRRIELHNRGMVPIDEVDDDFYDAPAVAGAAPVESAFAAYLGSRFAAARPRLVEAPFDLGIAGARIRGRIDAIYEPEAGWWEVVDFKSGRPGEDPARRVQLQAYALAVPEAGFAAEPPERLTVTFAYLGDGVAEVTEEVDDDWLDAARADVTALVTGAGAADFPATPSGACHTCDFLHLCPAGRAFVEGS